MEELLKILESEEKRLKELNSESDKELKEEQEKIAKLKEIVENPEIIKGNEELFELVDFPNLSEGGMALSSLFRGDYSRFAKQPQMAASYDKLIDFIEGLVSFYSSTLDQSMEVFEANKQSYDSVKKILDFIQNYSSDKYVTLEELELLDKYVEEHEITDGVARLYFEIAKNNSIIEMKNKEVKKETKKEEKKEEKVESKVEKTKVEEKLPESEIKEEVKKVEEPKKKEVKKPARTSTEEPTEEPITPATITPITSTVSTTSPAPSTPTTSITPIAPASSVLTKTPNEIKQECITKINEFITSDTYKNLNSKFIEELTTKAIRFLNNLDDSLTPFFEEDSLFTVKDLDEENLVTIRTCLDLIEAFNNNELEKANEVLKEYRTSNHIPFEEKVKYVKDFLEKGGYTNYLDEIIKMEEEYHVKDKINKRSLEEIKNGLAGSNPGYYIIETLREYPDCEEVDWFKYKLKKEYEDLITLLSYGEINDEEKEIIEEAIVNIHLLESRIDSYKEKTPEVKKNKNIVVFFDEDAFISSVDDALTSSKSSSTFRKDLLEKLQFLANTIQTEIIFKSHVIYLGQANPNTNKIRDLNSGNVRLAFKILDEYVVDPTTDEKSSVIVVLQTAAGNQKLVEDDKGLMPGLNLYANGVVRVKQLLKTFSTEANREGLSPAAIEEMKKTEEIIKLIEEQEKKKESDGSGFGGR